MPDLPAEVEVATREPEFGEALKVPPAEFARRVVASLVERGVLIPAGRLERVGAALIAAERQRQISEEGWTPEHDDGHDSGELADAAACYARAARLAATGWSVRDLRLLAQQPSSIYWPWDDEWWKPSDDPIRNLVKAGALIAAEIERLHRLRDPDPAGENA